MKKEGVLKERYSDEDLAEFRKLIEEKIESAEKQLALYQSVYKNGSFNGTDDTAPTFKSYDDGNKTMSREANRQLALRLEKLIRNLKNALIRIENNSHGIIRETGKLINKERLVLVP